MMKTRTTLQVVTLIVLFVVARVSSAQTGTAVPPAVVDSWSYLIGDWNVEGRVGSTPVNGSATFDLAEGKYCYVGRQVWRIGENGRSLHLSLIGGWDSAANETIEQGFSSSGDAATVHYRQPAERANVIEGRIDGVSGPGQRWAGTIKLQRNGPDEFLLTTTIDDEIVHSLKYVRKQGDNGTAIK